MSLTITNETKPGSPKTWNEYTDTWDESLPDTWDTQYGSLLTNESKSSLGITNESKPNAMTVDDMPVSIDSVSTTIDQAGTALTLEQKT